MEISFDEEKIEKLTSTKYKQILKEFQVGITDYVTKQPNF